MIVHDKAELKRRVRALVKRAAAVDTFVPADWAQGPWGVDAMLRTWMADESMDAETIDELFQLRCVQGLPIEPRAAETFATLSAMDMPMMDLYVVREREKLLGRVGYAQLALERAGLQKVFTGVPMEGAQEKLDALRAFAPEVEPVLRIALQDAPDERYGTQYVSCAEKARTLMEANGLRSVMFACTENPADERMLRSCVAPLCEDVGAVLHLHAPASQVQTVKALLRDFPSLRLIIRMHDDAAALEAAGRCEHALPCVSLSGLDRALAARGTAFIPYTSAATQPGELIGRWQNARAAIASSLTQALLPLARTGFAISSEDIEKHVTALMGGNVLALYE